MSAGRFREACPKLEESQRLDPGAGTLLNLALCREQEGRLATALVLFDEALRASRVDGRTDRVAIAEEHIAALQPRQARLVVRVGAPAAGLRITVDGVELREPAWGVATVIDSGSHRVEATAPGYRPFQAITDVRDGASSVVEVRLTASPETPRAITGRREKHPGFVPLMVVGALGLGTAAVGGYVWLLSSIARTPSSSSSSTSSWESGSRTATMIGLGTGIPCLVVALILPTHEVKARVSVGPSGGLISGTF